MLLGCLGAGLGLCVTEWLSLHTLGTTDPWFLAPMGASAVLLFAVPASPLAQPWSILGGNTVSALVGVSCALLLGHTGLAASAAGALAIAAMFALRCLHPPGGAVAVTAVMGGQALVLRGHSILWTDPDHAALLHHDARGLPIGQRHIGGKKLRGQTQVLPAPIGARGLKWRGLLGVSHGDHPEF